MTNFPANPTEGQTFTVNGVTYTFQGGAWLVLPGGGSSGIYVLKSGDKMDGSLELPAAEPSGEFMAAHQQYVLRKAGALVMAFNATPVVIPTGVITTLSWGSAPINDENIWNPATPGRITAPAWAKRVEIVGMCQWGAVSGTGRVLLILKNGAAMGRDDRGGYSVSGQSYSYTDTCVGGDYYQMAVFQDTGSNMNLNGGSPTRFSARFTM